MNADGSPIGEDTAPPPPPTGSMTAPAPVPTQTSSTSSEPVASSADYGVQPPVSIFPMPTIATSSGEQNPAPRGQGSGLRGIKRYQAATNTFPPST